MFKKKTIKNHQLKHTIAIGISKASPLAKINSLLQLCTAKKLERTKVIPVESIIVMKTVFTKNFMFNKVFNPPCLPCIGKSAAENFVDAWKK